MSLFKKWDWDGLYLRLQNFPTTNVRAISLTILDYLTFVFTATYMILCSAAALRVSATIVEVYQGWLIFLGACHGFSLGSYISKRTTSRDGNADEDTPEIVPPRTAEHAVIIDASQQR